MIRSIVSVVFATALMGSAAFALTHTSSTTIATQSNGTTEPTTTTTESFGTVTEFTPGDSQILQTEASEPMHYKFGKTVTYVNADGKVIEASTIRKSLKVHVHYVRHGDDMGRS